MAGGGWIIRNIASRQRVRSQRANGRSKRGGTSSRASRRRRSSSSGRNAGGYMAGLSPEMNRLWLEAVANDKGPSGNAYHWAIEMAGNAGQVAIIQKMGMSAFYDATAYAREGGDPYDVLEDACSHPEAVGEILIEVSGMITEQVEDSMMNAW